MNTLNSVQQGQLRKLRSIFLKKNIFSCWTSGHISNSSLEVFNNTIRWLIRKAYGSRNREYVKLKKTNSRKSTAMGHYELLSETVEEAKSIWCMYCHKSGGNRRMVLNAAAPARKNSVKSADQPR